MVAIVEGRISIKFLWSTGVLEYWSIGVLEYWMFSNSSAPIVFFVISTKGRNLLAWNCMTSEQHFSLAQTLAQTGFFSPGYSPGSVALGRAGFLYSSGYYSHVAPLAQTGMTWADINAKAVAPGRAGWAHSFEMTIWAELLRCSVLSITPLLHYSTTPIVSGANES
jgi:hypothetical protein